MSHLMTKKSQWKKSLIEFADKFGKSLNGQAVRHTSMQWGTAVNNLIIA
jgi:hypothetical protein